MKDYKYRAFLSYSHEDRHWARWLHRALEGYRVPSRLVGQHGLHGEIPRRLYPIFRDREDLTAHANLGDKITTALETSQFLIVVCSPDAAKSKWVGQEIVVFKALHGEGRVLSVIVDGEPFSSQKGEPDSECFPIALRYVVGSDGVISDAPCEPIAADARSTGDGKRGARLKIIAGMLGVELDDVVQRENHRRHRRQSLVTAASLVGMMVMSALTWIAVDARDEAEQRQARAEGLIEFMVGDLRSRLEPLGRLEVLDVIGRKALDYYAGQDVADLDFDALGRRSRVLHLIGGIDMSRGNLEPARKVFIEAERVTGELLAREPLIGQRIFDHAQSVFWLGYIAWQRGQMDQAEVDLASYLDLTHQLVLIDPDKEIWQQEWGYGNSNIGALFLEQSRFDKARTAFATSLEVSRRLYKAHPDAAHRYFVSQSLAWLADTEAGLSNYGLAEDLRRREIELYLITLTEDPQNWNVMDALMVARRKIASLKLARGDVISAETDLRAAAESADVIIASDPSNVGWVELGIYSYTAYSGILLHLGRFDEARRQAERGVALGKELVEIDAIVPNWHALYTASQNALARTLVRQGRTREALEVSQACLAKLEMVTPTLKTTRSLRWERLYLKSVIGQLLSERGEHEKASSIWRSVVGDVEQHGNEMGDRGAATLILAYRHTGRTAEADKLSRVMQAKGYRHPDFTRTLWGDSII